MCIPVRRMLTSVAWGVRTTTPFGNTRKTTASRLFRKIRIFRNEACSRDVRPSSFGSEQPIVRVPKSSISCERPSQPSPALFKRIRNRAWSLASAPKAARSHLSRATPPNKLPSPRAGAHDTRIARASNRKLPTSRLYRSMLLMTVQPPFSTIQWNFLNNTVHPCYHSACFTTATPSLPPPPPRRRHNAPP